MWHRKQNMTISHCKNTKRRGKRKRCFPQVYFFSPTPFTQAKYWRVSVPYEQEANSRECFFKAQPWRMIYFVTIATGGKIRYERTLPWTWPSWLALTNHSLDGWGSGFPKAFQCSDNLIVQVSLRQTYLEVFWLTKSKNVKHFHVFLAWALRKELVSTITYTDFVHIKVSCS